MTVGLDIRYLTHGLTGGVETYVRHLAHWLPRVAPDLRFVYHGDTKAPLALDDLPANVTLRLHKYTNPASSLWLDQRLAVLMAADGVQLAHFPANYGPTGPYRLVVTVHDTYNLFPFREHFRAFGKDPWRVSMMLYLGRQTRRALRRADWVVTVSEHARQDLAGRSGRPVDAITAIHEAADARFRLLPDEDVAAARARFQLPAHVLLADGIKNPAAAVEAWRRVPVHLRHDAALVFFSREARPRPEIADAVGADGIVFLPRPSSDDLVALMNLATALVFPSFYEGFGLPLVEAMSCGTGIIASTRGSVPEIVGGAGLLFDVEDTDALAAHLTTVLSDPATRDRLRAASLARARDFSWERAARQTADTYRRLLEGAKP